MIFQDYWKNLDKTKRKSLADNFGTSVEYMGQLASGHRNAGAKFLLGIEEATQGEVTAKELRHHCE